MIIRRVKTNSLSLPKVILATALERDKAHYRRHPQRNQPFNNMVQGV